MTQITLPAAFVQAAERRHMRLLFVTALMMPSIGMGESVDLTGKMTFSMIDAKSDSVPVDSGGTTGVGLSLRSSGWLIDLEGGVSIEKGTLYKSPTGAGLGPFAPKQISTTLWIAKMNAARKIDALGLIAFAGINHPAASFEGIESRSGSTGYQAGFERNIGDNSGWLLSLEYRRVITEAFSLGGVVFSFGKQI